MASSAVRFHRGPIRVMPVSSQGTARHAPIGPPGAPRKTYNGGLQVDRVEAAHRFLPRARAQEAPTMGVSRCCTPGRATSPPCAAINPKGRANKAHEPSSAGRRPALPNRSIELKSTSPEQTPEPLRGVACWCGQETAPNLAREIKRTKRL